MADIIKKPDLAELLFERYPKLYKSECLDIVDYIFKSMKDYLTEGNNVSIPELGNFRQNHLGYRTCFNLHENKKFIAPPINRIRFTPCPDLRKIK